MTLRLLLFYVISNLVYWSRAEIACYGCYNANLRDNETIKSCSNFDESEEFEIQCQDSTFCMKKTSELYLPGGRKIRIEERRCAPQVSKEHQYINNKWTLVNVVNETLYEEGCSWEQSDEKAAKIEYCYCSSDYCNTGQRTTETSLFHHTDAMSVIFIFNVVKLMRSIR